jgi:hypothetical protein
LAAEVQWLEPRLQLSSIVVNSTSDTPNYAASVTVSQLNPTSTPVTLRDAIDASNNTSGAQLIRFDPTVFPAGRLTTITLNATLNLTNTSGQITIQGPGAGQVAINGNDQNTVFLIVSNVVGEIDSVTVTGGHATIVTPDSTALAGGGIYNKGALSLSNDLIANNSALGSLPKAGDGGGLYNLGTLTVTNCIVSGNSAFGNVGGAGGGLFNSGTMVVTNSTVSGNTTGTGGGIWNNGTATIIGSTLSGNSTQWLGMGFTAPGGGIFNFGSITVINCTMTANFAANNAGGGLFDSGQAAGFGQATITDSTISGNFARFGGGIEFGAGGLFGSIKLSGSIVAGNTVSSTDSTPSDWFGKPADASSSHDLIGVGTNSGLMNGINNNLVGTSGNPLNAHLATLGNNGGLTQTMALLVGSPAVGAGANFQDPQNNPITTDQRGLSRVIGGVDIGAFQSATILSITRLMPVANATSGSTVTFAVTFNEPVLNVVAGDFTVNIGSLGVTPENSSIYRLTVSGLGAFNGTLTLGIVPGESITDAFGIALINTTPTLTDDGFYVIDHNAPATTPFAGEYNVSTNGSGMLTLASIVPSGTQLILIGSTVAVATITSTTQFQVVGGAAATYGESIITFGSSGPFANQVWTKLDLPTNYTDAEGAGTHVITNGNSITFVDEFGNTRAAIWINPTQLTAFGLRVTVGSGKLTASNGTVWYENVSLPGSLNGSGRVNISAAPSQFTVYDYTNASGTSVHVIGTGTTHVVFVDGLGRMSLGSFFNTTQAKADLYPGDVATFSTNQVFWQDGTVWTKAAMPSTQITVTNYLNPRGVAVHAARNNSGNVAFLDSLGLLSLGTFINATQAVDNAYPGAVATFSALALPPFISWTTPIKGTNEIEVTPWNVTFNPPITITATDVNGTISHLKFLSRATLVGLDGPFQGVQGTRLNGKIFWANGQVWTNFDFNSLNAFFEIQKGTAASSGLP